jgi:hypothetical protein
LRAPTFEASVNGIPIYLDNFAIIALAKGDISLRQRFVSALHNGADLLFSIANGIEISGAQGASALAIKTFLDELGRHWYPVDFNPHGPAKSMFVRADIQRYPQTVAMTLGLTDYILWLTYLPIQLGVVVASSLGKSRGGTEVTVMKWKPPFREIDPKLGSIVGIC